LLERFASDREEAAFDALVSRHGPLVYHVCRRLLMQAADVEDAFQATFLVLVRRAGAIERAQSVASWLYGVAYPVPARLRRDNLRRRGPETPWRAAARLFEGWGKRQNLPPPHGRHLPVAGR